MATLLSRVCVVTLLALAFRNAPARAEPASEPAPLPAAPRTLASWHRAFDELRTGSERYRSASAEVEKARGRARVALADLLPRAQAQASFTHELIVTEENFGAGPVTVPAQDVWGAGVSVNVALLDARALHAHGTARREVRASQDTLAAERVELARELVDVLLTAWTAERLAEQHRAGLRAALERLALTQTKRTLGRATVLDVDRARQDVESARTDALHGDDALHRARVELGLLLGARTATAAPAVSDAEGLERALGAFCSSHERFEAAPRIAAAEAQLELSERALAALDLELLPRLDAQSQLRWDSETVYGPDATMQLGLIVSAPIWDGGARYGHKRAAHAARMQARLTLDAARREVRSRASESTRAVGVAEEAARIGAAQRELAVRIDEATRVAFEQGVGTSLDLVAAAEARRRAELQAVLLVARLTQARAHAALAYATCQL